MNYKLVADVVCESEHFYPVTNQILFVLIVSTGKNDQKQVHVFPTGFDFFSSSPSPELLRSRVATGS